jgi:sulfur-carrier protein adenylyltransferase/sulfurtransferase
MHGVGDATFQRTIAAAAIRAPSGDNCQPWRFRFANDRMEIHLLRDRAASFFDFRNRGSYISIGAVVENVRVQAACMELAVEVAYPDGEPEADAPIVGVSFRPGVPANDECRARLAAVHGRTVNRRPFLPFRIGDEQQRQWIVDAVEGTETTVIEDRREIARWARVTYLGDRIRWTHPVIHRELFASIRFNRDEAERLRTGLEIDRLGAGPVAVPVMRTLASWPRMQRLARFGVDTALANQTRALVHCAGALVLVAIAGDTVAHWIRAGEQVQRLWTVAQQQGLCVQPAPVAMYLDQRFQREGGTNFEPAHRPLLEAVHSELAPLLGGRIGAMLYRVGHGWRMSHPAVRLAPESFYDAPDAG